ncbi:MAG: hypothetical protein A2138_25650 [Deltaproteobacteria bacterium RBG_16_71_12]|nr:MAG: hypothetical protein A2138_25650 [Deltaproteobacteria bacterium RBG_16_71_12]
MLKYDDDSVSAVSGPQWSITGRPRRPITWSANRARSLTWSMWLWLISMWSSLTCSSSARLRHTEPASTVMRSSIRRHVVR